LETLCISCHMKEHHAETIAARIRNRDAQHAKEQAENPGKRWARDYACCKSCGTTKVRHGGKGLCRTCRLKMYNGSLQQG
jgi:hypothetical protein